MRFDFKYEYSKAKEKFFQSLAHNLPKRIIYFASIKLIAETTSGEWSNTVVPELTAMDAIQRYSIKYKI